MEKFYTSGDEFFIVEASSSEQAYTKAAEVFYKEDEIFLDHMACRTVNMSFAEKFFIQTDEKTSVFNTEGKIIIDNDEFISRVKSYFGSHIKAAEEYLSYWFLDADESDTEITFKKFISTNKDFLIHEWKNFTDYDVLDISEIKMIY